MHLLEILPIFSTVCLIVGDTTQLIRVIYAHHCRSISLLKWGLSFIANLIMPFYYYAQYEYTAMSVAILLALTCFAICVIIISRRSKSHAKSKKLFNGFRS